MPSTPRDFKNSADACAAGFTTIQWLRAFTTKEHGERIRASQRLSVNGATVQA